MLKYQFGNIFRFAIAILFSNLFEPSAAADSFSTGNVITLENAGIQVNKSINISSGFSFRFRTCNLGTILSGENSLFELALYPGNRFTQISFKWKYESSFKNLSLEPYYLLNSNIDVKVNFFLSNSTGYIFEVLPNQNVHNISSYQIFVNKRYFNNFIESQNFIVGSKEFVGCIYSGNNVEFNLNSSKCELEFGSPCVPKKDCPTGFTGRFCHVNIDDCVYQDEKCHQAVECIDLINDFKCVCKNGWSGRLCENSSFCEPNPCKNGVCQLNNEATDYVCVCQQGFTGRNCEIKAYPCLSSPCQNGGTCSNTSDTTYKCSCVPGFRGLNCQSNKDDCATQPCGDGRCIDGVNNYTCNCTGSGLTGDTCNIDIDECKPSYPNPCKRNSTCVNEYGDYECVCLAGYTGKDCDQNIDDCKSNPCGNGTCHDALGGFSCTCNTGFTGNTCQINVDDCINSNCSNGGTCVDLINGYSCDCPPGFSGNFCEININDCVPNPCLNNGSCIDHVASYSCNCTAGFTGQNCSININDCEPDPCLNGECIDLVNAFQCNCTQGFNGTKCETNIDDCVNNSCLNYGTCKDGINNYTCTCIPSFTGRYCETYQDPCNPDPCENGGVCLNDTMKGYSCNCTEKFGGNNCANKIGFCFPNNPCVKGECSETNGTYKCACPSGYEGRNCSKNINECEQKPCLNGICIDTDGSFYCNCSGSGYKGSNCSIDIDECEENEVSPCFNNAECINSIGAFYCKCNGNYVGDLCQKKYFVCASHKVENGEDYCFNNGTCSDLPEFKMECACAPGFNGKQCKINIDECEQNFCKNSFNCTDLINDYTCNCLDGWTGKNCTEDIDECETNECKNNATCINLLNKYECDCKPGFNGTFCENDIDWCSYRFCQHGSNCSDIGATYSCDCFPGYSGKDCSVDFPDCRPNPCAYNNTVNNLIVDNTCIERSNLTAMRLFNQTVDENTFKNRDGYICLCVDGLKGENCSMNPNNCNVSSCYNNGTCVDLIDRFQCKCTDAFIGDRCETLKNSCFSSPCFNDAVCQGDAAGYNCTCQPGFAGTLCDKHTTISLNGEGYWMLAGEAFSSAPITLVTFRFITTLSDVVLATLQIDGPLYHLVLRKSDISLITPRNKENTILLTGSFSNNKWHTIGIRKTSPMWEIFINGDQKRASIDNLGDRIQNITVGGSQNLLQKGHKNFTGCIQDVSINNENQIPVNNTSNNGYLLNIVAGKCQREIVCDTQACSERGNCQDLWVSKKCDCNRQYFGNSCEKEIQAFSFKSTKVPGNSTIRRRSVNNQFVRSDVNIKFGDNSFSALIRTRQEDALIALFSSTIPADVNAPFVYVLLTIEAGFLTLIKVTRTGTNETSHKERFPKKINDGVWHEIFVNNKIISVDSINQTLNTTFDPFHVQSIYIGGYDPSVALLNNLPSLSRLNTFDGCLQAVRFGNAMLTNQVLTEAPTVNVSLAGAELGCGGRNGCSSTPCLFNGNCTDLWDEFNCSCKQAFGGKDCSVYGCSVYNPCSQQERCINVPGQPGQVKCSSTLTYNGKDSQTSIVLRTVNDISISFDIRTRQVNAFIMGVVKSNDEYFLVGFKNGNLLLSSNISRQFTAAQVPAASNGQWMNVSIVKNSSSADAIITINSLPLSISTTVFGSNWTNFVMSQNLTIGLYNSTIVAEDYGNVALEGSLTNVIIGGIHYNLATDGISTPSVVNGSQSSRDVCAEQPCKNNRTCHDDFNDFRCDCGSFYTFKTCNETVNVTCAFKTDLCQNGGSCLTLDPSQAVNHPVYSDNGVDLFKCNCIAGYNGTFCEKNIDECLFGFCQNSNNCTDLINDYQCNCAAGWTSKNCTTEIDECNSIPCKNGGTCKDLFNDFNCTCTSAWSGPTCTTDVDECAANIHECKRNSTCKNIDGDYECICLEGTTGNRCQLDAPDDDEIEAWVIGVAVAGGLLVIILLILLCWLCLYFRKNSGMEGTYSPNKEEQQSGNVEMNTLKKPNAERLI